MEYQEAIDYLYKQLPMFSRVGAAAYKPGLDTSLQLDEFFGHPHRRFRSIHIGGTNGKGSTSHMLAAMLQSQGYKVGLYTSPHLVDFRERMRVNGSMIHKENVANFVKRFRESNYQGHPSFFELTMMMAFDWFASERVDFAIIEVGMGGRLDSTNIITPEMAVITNISPDHMQFLGDTLPKIATEKAGIIKKGIPVVIGEAEGDIKEVFKNRATEVGAPITFAEETKPLTEIVKCEEGGWQCTSSVIGNFKSPLSGDYQIKNINTVLEAVKVMRKIGIPLSDTAACKGLEDVDKLTGLLGRWTILQNNPKVICDTGHNEAGLHYNLNQLKECINSRSGSKLKIVMGFVADKDIDHILPMFPKDAEYFITNAAIPRALPVTKLATICNEFGFNTQQYQSVIEAYNAALSSSSPNDIIYVGGSTFIVADLLSALQK
jgi:dihydrofolate synthase/folylpolyglutamate synthase